MFSGTTVTVFVVAGFVGSLAIAAVANHTKALTPIAKYAYGLGVVFAIMMMEVSVKHMSRSRYFFFTKNKRLGLCGLVYSNRLCNTR